MVFRVALSLTLLLFIIDNLIGSKFEASCMRALLVFIIFYAAGLGFEFLFLHIQVHLKRLEQEEDRKDEEDNQGSDDEVAKMKANAITSLFSKK